eukprot:SAG31_NODE_42649_length_270_cov_1.187135_1_plen_32_part_01
MALLRATLLAAAAALPVTDGLDGAELAADVES